MKEMYFTMAGCNHYYGSDFMEKGMKVKLVKEPDNEYDSEAIQVKIKGLGKVGYVANSPYTVKGESMSAGRLYDKIGGKAKGKIVFVTDGGVICKVISDGKDKPVMIEEDKVYGNGISKILRRIHLVGKVSIQKIVERRGNMQQR